MTTALAHYYRLYRAQNPRMTALDAYWSARRQIHFRAVMAADLAAHKRRSAAAKRAWKTRRRAA